MPPCLLLLAALLAQADPEARSWNQPVEPFKIIRNIHFVGANEITSYLITTPQGHILLDGGLVETAPQILANIRKLGFRPEDVKVLINSQAHFDHAGGFAELKRITGASLAVMDGDAQLVEAGGHGDFFFGDKLTYPPAHVDRLLHDSDTVSLGGTTFKAVLTAGHTRGCTSWKTTVAGKAVVFLCSVTFLSGYPLKELAPAYRESFRRLESMPCDVFLGAHGSFFDLTKKRGRGPEAFIDKSALREHVRRQETAFEAALLRQR